MEIRAVDKNVYARLQALLFEPILKPLGSAFGAYGDLAVSEFSKALAKELSS
jgi:hypothetical protein